jgi:glycosyltransferase involved in cell wall biosynthesis
VSAPSTLILTPSRELGGTEAHLETIARGALAAGARVTVALDPMAELEPLRAALRGAGARVVALRLGQRRDSRLGALTSLVRDLVAVGVLLARRRPGAVLVELPYPDACPGALLACALARVRTLAVFHLVRPDATLTASRARLYALIRRLGPRVRWAAVSPDNRASTARLFAIDADRIAVIDNGVPHHDRDADARHAVRAELHAAGADVVVLTVGRLSEQKDHATIVAALDALAAAAPAVVLWWAGSGPLEASLRAAVARSAHAERVRLLGRRADVAALLAGADLFLLPSRFEGAPLALLEAMAAGLPVVVSDIGAHRDVVADGHTGVTFAPGDPAALARRVAWAAAHPDEMAAMAARAQGEVRARHAAATMVADTLRALWGTP